LTVDKFSKMCALLVEKFMAMSQTL